MELVNEMEMQKLARFFRVISKPIGFFFGVTESGPKELIHFPGLCEECQKREVNKKEKMKRRTGDMSGC